LATFGGFGGKGDVRSRLPGADERSFGFTFLPVRN
jgi:hypothetical protein